MSIISKDTWDKFTQEEKERVQKLYEHYEDDALLYGDEPHKLVKANLESIFPEEALQPQPLTYEDVARELFGTGIDEKGHFATVHCLGMKWDNKIQAIGRLLVVAKFLNKDWKPDWEKIGERKFYVSSNDNKINISYVFGDNSSPVYFRTKELAEKAVSILGEDTVRLTLSSDW